MELKKIKELAPREKELYQMELIRSSFDTQEEERWIEFPVAQKHNAEISGCTITNSGSTTALNSGVYLISTWGRIMHITKKRGKRILSPTYCTSGFWITLQEENGGKRIGRRIDRLMGWFHGYSYESIRIVTHLKNSRFQNNLKNLEFVLWES